MQNDLDFSANAQRVRHGWNEDANKFCEMLGINACGAVAVAVRDYALSARQAGLGRAVHYSRNRNNYRKDTARYRGGVGYNHMRAGISELAGHGLIKNRIAAPNPNSGIESIFCAEPALIEAIPKKPRLSSPAETIIVRAADGSFQGYSDNLQTSKMRRNMIIINKSLCGLDVRGGDGAEIEVPGMARIFNGAFVKGGRLYGQGASWQNAEKSRRCGMTIDGKSCVECDFSCLHIWLLYSERGLALDGDAYDLNGWSAEYRGLIKRAVNILLNASGWHQARGALAVYCEDCPELGNPEETAAALIKSIKRRHAAIRHAFHSGAGRRLMRVDSNIAECALMRMVKAGAPCLPIHDGFITQNQHCGVLQEVMNYASKQCSGVEIPFSNKPL